MLAPPTRPPKTTVPPKISTWWDTEADCQGIKAIWEMGSGVEWKASDEGSSTHGTRKDKLINDRVRKYILHAISLNKKGERWQHFTCWRMKVFIVAKMRATLQKAAQRHDSNPAWYSTSTSDHHILQCDTGSRILWLLPRNVNGALTLHTPAHYCLKHGSSLNYNTNLFALFSPLGCFF